MDAWVGSVWLYTSCKMSIRMSKLRMSEYKLTVESIAVLPASDTPTSRIASPLEVALLREIMTITVDVLEVYWHTSDIGTY